MVRKAGAFTSGQLLAGQLGVDTTNDRVYYSTDGTDIVMLVDASIVGAEASNVLHVVHGATAGTARPTCLDGSAFSGKVIWQGSVEPTNMVNGDSWEDTA